MDNATDALMIAGGILIAILVISLFMYMFNNAKIIPTEEISQDEIDRLARWNAEWEAYNKKLLYGAEVLSVMNKAEQNNKEYGNADRYKVTIKILDGSVEMTRNDIERNAIFECIEIKESATTGRINEMVFKLIK